MHKAWSNIEEVPYCFSRSSVKQSSILTWIGRFWTVTPVWFHWWLWNDAQSLKQHRLSALYFFKDIRQLSKSSILTRIGHFRTDLTVWIHRWLWNDAQSLMWYRKGAPLFFKVIHQISRSHSPKNWWFESNLRNITRPVVAIKSLRIACVTLKFHIWPWKIIGHIF